MQMQTGPFESEISDAEVEAEIFRIIKAHEDRPHLIKSAVKDQMKGIPSEQIRRALDRLSLRSIVS
jgi:hypothetical protein